MAGSFRFGRRFSRLKQVILSEAKGLYRKSWEIRDTSAEWWPLFILSEAKDL